MVAHPPLPEPAGSVYPEDGAAYVDAFTADQLLDYAGQCVREATAECSEHWQQKMWNACARAGELEREKLRAALLAMHERDKDRHNYWKCAAVELFGA